MCEKDDIEEDLKPSYGDYAHVGVKTGLSTIPLIGGPIEAIAPMINNLQFHKSPGLIDWDYPYEWIASYNDFHPFTWVIHIFGGCCIDHFE